MNTAIKNDDLEDKDTIFIHFLFFFGGLRPVYFEVERSFSNALPFEISCI
jgi:hypothetical protein